MTSLATAAPITATAITPTAPTASATSCVICRAAAAETCGRCGRPLCFQHQAQHGTRCIDCELVFVDSQPSWVAPLIVVVTAVLIVGSWVLAHRLGAAGYMTARGGDTGWAVSVVYATFTLVAIGVGQAVNGLLHWGRRGLFLRERAS